MSLITAVEGTARINEINSIQVALEKERALLLKQVAEAAIAVDETFAVSFTCRCPNAYAAERIKELRLKRGLSEERLGDLAAATSNIVSMWESNKISITVRQLALIARALEVPITELLPPS